MHAVFVLRKIEFSDHTPEPHEADCRRIVGTNGGRARSDLAVTYQGPHSVNFQAGGAKAVVAQRVSDVIYSR